MAMQPNMFTLQPRARISSTWYYITTLLSKFGKKWNIGPPGEAAAKWDRDSWLVAEGTLSTTEQNKENQSRDVDVLCVKSMEWKEQASVWADNQDFGEGHARDQAWSKHSEVG